MNCLSLDQTGGEDACGTCASCKRIARGVHADVLLVEPGESGTIKIDQVREAIDRAAYRPFEGRRRVVIVDDADALNAEAQNALLKTLEEPPAASTFVLVTSRPDMLLPTVLSRCQRLRFGRLVPGGSGRRSDSQASILGGRRARGRVAVRRQHWPGARRCHGRVRGRQGGCGVAAGIGRHII